MGLPLELHWLYSGQMGYYLCDMSIICMFYTSFYHHFEYSFTHLSQHSSSFLYIVRLQSSIGLVLHTFCILELFQVLWSYLCSERGKTEQKVTFPPTYSITSSRDGSSQLSSPSRHLYSIAEERRQSILQFYSIAEATKQSYFASPPVLLDRRGEELVHPDS